MRFEANAGVFECTILSLHTQLAVYLRALSHYESRPQRRKPLAGRTYSLQLDCVWPGWFEAYRGMCNLRPNKILLVTRAGRSQSKAALLSRQFPLPVGSYILPEVTSTNLTW